MPRSLAQLVGWRLQYVLITGFVLTTTITIAVFTPVTYSLISNPGVGCHTCRVEAVFRYSPAARGP